MGEKKEVAEDKGERQDACGTRITSAWHEVGWQRGDACVPRQSREKERRALTGGPGRGKINKSSLKFETKVFPGSKIH